MDFSYRSKRGVKLNVRHTSSGFPRASVDFSDKQTREIMKEELEKWAKYDIVGGKLIKREE